MTTDATTLLTELTVNLVLRRSSFGNRRKTEQKLKATNEAEGWTRMTKSLLKSDELDAIKRLDGDVRAWMWATALPHPILRDGAYIVPVALMPTVESYLRDKQAYRETLIAAFVQSYPAQIEAAAEKLGIYYNRADYPTPTEMANKFSMSWYVCAETAPAQLSAISDAFFVDVRDKAEAQFAQAITDMRTYLRESLKVIVDHMADRLTDKEDGTRKKFHATIVTRLEAFLDTFDLRNVTDDVEMAAVISELKMLTAGVTPDTLRTDTAFRQHVSARLSDITSTLDDLVVTSSSRALSLVGEDD